MRDADQEDRAFIEESNDKQRLKAWMVVSGITRTNSSSRMHGVSRDGGASLVVCVAAYEAPKSRVGNHPLWQNSEHTDRHLAPALSRLSSRPSREESLKKRATS
jgi:hypothetical protein